jgi:peroxiredoxin
LVEHGLFPGYRGQVKQTGSGAMAGNTMILRFFLLILLLVLVGCVQEEKSKVLQLGDSAPDFAVKDLDGKVIVLSSLKGNPVILRFFETDCRFCKADTPAFTKFYDENKGKGLQILYVGSFYESVDRLREFTEELGVGFPVAMDGDARLADLYDIRAYPQTLFISPDQKLLAAILGGVGEAELKEILGKYL